jgi:arsenite methyltransferase
VPGYGDPVTADKWASWLLSRRDGGDAEVRRRQVPGLLRFRDGVLGRAAIRPGDVVLDVGAGDGLIGFGALDRVGDTGRVIFSDISADLLDECRRRAAGDPRCEFVQASADDLAALADGTVDVVTTRSVLIYLERERKAAAFAAFFRVLRPGGRLSIFEPINRFAASPALFGYDVTPVAELIRKVRGHVEAGSSTMTDFDERDLLAWASQAGFTAVTLDYRAEVDVPAPSPGDWDAVKRTAPNPLAPTFEEAMAATLTDAERDRLEDHFRTLIAAGTAPRRTLAVAFLSAVRP